MVYFLSILDSITVRLDSMQVRQTKFNPVDLNNPSFHTFVN